MLVLVNKDPASGVQASVDVGAPITAAAAVYLQAPGLGATTGVLLSGAGVSATGSWSPAPPFRLAFTGGNVVIPLPPATAAIVRVR